MDDEAQRILNTRKDAAVSRMHEIGMSFINGQNAALAMFDGGADTIDNPHMIIGSFEYRAWDMGFGLCRDVFAALDKIPVIITGKCDHCVAGIQYLYGGITQTCPFCGGTGKKLKGGD